MNKVLEFFEEICAIPRVSKHEEGMVNFLCFFAQKRGLRYHADDFNNVIIWKDSLSKKTREVCGILGESEKVSGFVFSVEAEEEESKEVVAKKQPIILQSHIDMVATKIPSLEFDFLTDPIPYYYDGDWIKTLGTTLGADNGIGVAIMLSLLDSDNENFPPIEAVFTADEEAGMSGAKNLNISMLSAKNFLSLDNGKESEMNIACAAVARISAEKKLQKVDMPKTKLFTLNLEGFQGGHSGCDIDKNRLNAIYSMCEILQEIDVKVVSKLNGGNGPTAIPSYASSTFASDKNFDEIQKTCEKMLKNMQKTEKSATFSLSIEEKAENQPELYEVSKLAQEILSLPNGLLSTFDNGDKKTSQNLGILEISGGFLKIQIAARCSEKTEVDVHISALMHMLSEREFDAKILEKSPLFSTSKDDEFVNQICKSHEKFYGKKIKLNRTHGGLEGGVFSEKNPSLSIAVMGPTMHDIHAPTERVSVSSTNRFYDWMVAFLEEYL